MINYIKQFEDGSTQATVNKPVWGEVSATSDYYLNGQWFNSSGVVYTPQFTYASKDGKLLGVEVANGQPVDLHYDEYAPTLVEDTIQADTMLSDNFVGKNACTAWVNFDGTTTPPTIRDSFNVSDVVRTSTGKYVVNFTTDMDTTSYGANISHDDGFTQDTNGGEQYSDKTISSVKCSTYITSSSVGRDAENITLHIIGGKN